MRRAGWGVAMRAAVGCGYLPRLGDGFGEVVGDLLHAEVETLTELCDVAGGIDWV